MFILYLGLKEDWIVMILLPIFFYCVNLIITIQWIQRTEHALNVGKGYYMLNLGKLNGGFDSPFEKVDGENFKFIDRNKFNEFGKKFLLLGVYRSEGKLGVQTVFICSEINDSSKGFRFSTNDVSKFNAIMADNDIITAIKQKKLTVTFEKYFSDKWKKDCIGTTFEEL